METKRSSERFRALLKAHREGKRWSQERLAEESDLDHSLISRIESGQRSPTRDSIAKLARGPHDGRSTSQRGLNLTAAEYDQLLLAAGFRPHDPAAMIAAQPEAARLFRLLDDEGALGPGARTVLRRMVSDAMSMAELATSAKGG